MATDLVASQRIAIVTLPNRPHPPLPNDVKRIRPPTPYRPGAAARGDLSEMVARRAIADADLPEDLAGIIVAVEQLAAEARHRSTVEMAALELAELPGAARPLDEPPRVMSRSRSRPTPVQPDVGEEDVIRIEFENDGKAPATSASWLLSVWRIAPFGLCRLMAARSLTRFCSGAIPTTSQCPTTGTTPRWSRFSESTMTSNQWASPKLFA